MNKALKVIEYIWIGIAVLSLFEIFNLWSEQRTKSYIFMGFFVMAVLMYFLRRNQRLNREKRKHS